MKTAFVTLCLAALVTGISLRSPNMVSLSKIDASPYGRQLLDTVSLQVRSGASVDRIVELLDELASGLREEQSQDDALNVTRQNECDTEIEAYHNTIAYTQSEIDDAERLLGEYYPDLEETIAELETKEKEIESLTKEIDDLEADYRADLADYNDRVADHKDAITSLQSVLDELYPMVGSEAGEGIHDNSKRIEAEEKAGVLLQTKADQATLERIIELLEETKENLETGIEDENGQQSEADQDYSELHADMTRTLADLNTAKNSLAEHKAHLESEIAQEEERKERNTRERDAAQEALEAKEKICEEWRQKYFSDSAKRSDELDLIQQVREIFTEELSDVNEYLTERSE
jgi:chromosome segregation ATPase